MRHHSPPQPPPLLSSSPPYIIIVTPTASPLPHHHRATKRVRVALKQPIGTTGACGLSFAPAEVRLVRHNKGAFGGIIAAGVFVWFSESPNRVRLLAGSQQGVFVSGL
ncbi:hypothetical protein Tco_0042425 [Tanacetum coccineum]